MPKLSRADRLQALVFGALAGPALAALAGFGMLWREQAVGDRFWMVVALFAACGFLSGLLAWGAAARLARGSLPVVRFAAMLVLLLVLTPSALVVIQATMTLLRESDPVMPPPTSPEWVLAGAIIGAVFFSAATGLKLVLPGGLVVLFAGAVAFARARERAPLSRQDASATSRPDVDSPSGAPP